MSLESPMYTLEEWYDYYKNQGRLFKDNHSVLMVNGNWFNVFSFPGQSLSPKGYPYRLPVTTTYGLSISKGEPITSADVKDPRGCSFDSLVVYGEDGNHTINIIKHDQIRQNQAEIKFAVSGFQLLKNGEYNSMTNIDSENNEKTKYKECNSTNSTIARTAIGLSKDKQKMVIMVYQPGSLARDRGLNEQQLVTRIGQINLNLDPNGTQEFAKEVINLDNSGSAQFLYASNGKISKQSIEGDLISNINNLTPDSEEGVSVHRLVPNFFGIYQ